MTTTTKSKRGFAAMDPKLVSEIARKGGKAAHSAGTAHEFTTEEAREAGRKGGKATHAKRQAAPTTST
jgi:general stress protein YciG